MVTHPRVYGQHKLDLMVKDRHRVRDRQTNRQREKEKDTERKKGRQRERERNTKLCWYRRACRLGRR